MTEFQPTADRLPWLQQLPHKNRKKSPLSLNGEILHPVQGEWNPYLSLTGDTVVDEEHCIETAIATVEESQGVGSLRVGGRPRGSATASYEMGKVVMMC